MFDSNFYLRHFYSNNPQLLNSPISEDNRGTPLIFSTVNNNKKAVKILLNLGANPNQTDHYVTGKDIAYVSFNNKETAISYATRHNNNEIARYLLNRSANPFLKDVHGKSAYDYTQGHSHKPEIVNPELYELFTKIKEKQKTLDNTEEISSNNDF
jgi:ankyrin repeat protein